MSLTTTEKAMLAGAVAVIVLVTACTLHADEALKNNGNGTVTVVNPITMVPCPAGVKSCKIVVITDQEEQTLVGPEMIFAHASWANRVKFDSLVQAWVEKLRQAPQGVVQTDPAGKEPAKPEGNK